MSSVYRLVEKMTLYLRVCASARCLGAKTYFKRRRVMCDGKQFNIFTCYVCKTEQVEEAKPEA